MKSAAAFVGLTFVLSWGAWGAAIVLQSEAALWRIAGAFGPTLAAVTLAGLAGRRAIGLLLRGFSKWRAPAWVYLFAMVSTATVGALALGLDHLLGGAPVWPDIGTMGLIPVIFLWVLLFSVAGEETGWRGYLLPRFLDRMGPLTASLLIGVIWGLWHLPLWALPGDFHATIPVTLFLLQLLGFSILYTWLWLESGGSLVVAHVFHAASNTTLGVMPLLPGQGADGVQALWIAVGLLWIVAAVVAFRLSRTERFR